MNAFSKKIFGVNSDKFGRANALDVFERVPSLNEFNLI